MIDSVNLKKIKDIYEYLPISGFTSNPSIIAKELSNLHKDVIGAFLHQLFYDHMQNIAKSIEINLTLHIQTLATTVDDIVKKADFIKKHISSYVYIKIPTTKEGLKAIKNLKFVDKDFRISATAIYDITQALYAVALNADYVIPYVNRIEKNR